MLNSDKPKLLFCFLLSFLLGASLFWHGIRYEEMVVKTKDDNAEKTLGYIWTFLFYIICLLMFQNAFVQISSVVRGIIFLKLDVKDSRKTNASDECKPSVVEKIKENIASTFSRMQNMYESLFGIKRGRYFYYFVSVLELVEILIQFFNFQESCKNSNLYYICTTVGLMLVNSVVSPLLLVMWHNRKDITVPNNIQITRKIVIYSVDSLLDLSYFFNNLYRGGESVSSLNSELFFNMALLFPAVSLALRIMEVSDAILYEEENAIDENKFSFKTMFAKKRRQEKRNHKQSESRTYFDITILAQNVLSSMIILLGIVGTILLTINLSITYAKCDKEFTSILWKSAFPKKMLTRGLFKNPTCGYEHIISIDSNNSKIVSLPEALGKCKNLKILYLENNNISKLPRGLLLLQNLESVSFNMNPVYMSLNIDQMDLHDRKYRFPTKFLCDHLSSLKYLSARNNNIKTIHACIKNFRNLLALNLENNNIVKDGLPNAILGLLNAKFHFRNNPVATNLSWRKRGLKDLTYAESKVTGVYDIKSALNFSISHFKCSLRNLDLSENDGLNGMDALRLLDSLFNLEVLNISKSGIKNIFGQDKDIKHKADQLGIDRWKKLRVLDISNNELSKIDSSFALYVEMHSHVSFMLNKVKLDTVHWPKRGMKIFPKRIMDKLKTTLLWIQIEEVAASLNFKLPLDYFCGFKKLSALRLQNFLFSSPVSYIPLCFQMFGTLSLIDLQGGPFNFTWPNSFKKLTYLELKLGTPAYLNSSFTNLKVGSIFDSNLSLPFTRIQLLDLGIDDKMPHIDDAKFPDLIYFDISRSNVVGTLPKYNLTKLSSFRAMENRLEGSIPLSLLSNKNLQYVYLNNNMGLNGTLPELPESKTFECLSLHETSIRGFIPSVYIKNIKSLLTVPYKGFNISNLVKDIPSTRVGNSWHYGNFMVCEGFENSNMIACHRHGSEGNCYIQIPYLESSSNKPTPAVTSPPFKENTTTQSQDCKELFGV